MAERNNAYAEALFALAAETGMCEEISSGLNLLTELFSQYPEYAELLSTPALSKEERASLAHAAFDGRIPADLISFLLILCDKRDLEELSACSEAYDGLYRDSLRTATAYVCSATELTEEQKERLKGRLEKISGKRVFLSCIVDPSLLGGITVELDGTVYDGSLRHRMDDMKKVMDQ